MARNPHKGPQKDNLQEQPASTEKGKSISAQLASLKKTPGVPHEVLDYLSRLSPTDGARTPMAHAAAALPALTSDAVAPSQLADIVFDLDASTTATTRVHLPGKTDDIVNSANPHGVLHNQLVGTFVTVVIQVSGDQSAVGVVDVQHASPGSFQLKVSDGSVGTKPLFVTG